METVKVEVNLETVEACRICLAWDAKLYDISEWGLDAIFVELTGTNLSTWDGFPQHVCSFCRAGLVKAAAMRARSQRADALLKQALMHQHFITNDFIRTVDRVTHDLAHTLSSVGGKVEVQFYVHDENTPNPSHSNFVEPIDNDIQTDDTAHDVLENDLKEFDINCDHIPSVIDLDPASDVKVQENIDNENETANIAKQSPDIEIKQVKTKKRKVRKKKAKVTLVRQKEKRSKRAQFCTEEDFKEFEKKYDFQVQVLTDEEIALEMEKRKQSNKYLKGEYKCNLCYKGFMTKSIYDNHMKTHDPTRGEMECGICHVRFNYPVKLRQHTQNAHRLRFRCAQCNEVVRGKACAVLHAAYHAGTTFKCAHCDRQFLKKTSRTSHMRASHPLENAAGGTCELCGETFTSRTGLKTHKTRSHKQVNAPNLKCRRCVVQFENIEALRTHKETQPDKKCNPSLSACEQCGETCAGADELIMHRHEQHDLELFSCDTCTKSFTSKASLATHMDRIHRRIRPPKADYSDGGRRKPDWLHWASVCEHCGKRLSCRATLKIHMNKHTGERPYKCSLCPKAYLTPYGLQNHQASHTGVRKWQCPECPATFMHQSSVYTHRKIHTGERAHHCTICDKYFTQSGSLYTHVKYVHMKETPPPRKRNKKPAAS